MDSRKELLDKIKVSKRFKKLDDNQLKSLCKELRDEVIEAVSVTGGHLGAGLGVVELTVAIHSVFNTPNDKLIWDVGHQCYPHKVITGRRDKIRTIRQPGGLYGFTKDRKVNTIHLGPHILQPQFLLVLEWLWPGTLKKKIIK